jgi:3'-5' exoribonuclease
VISNNVLLISSSISSFEFPAAKRNHHAFAGGLAFHTLTMLRLGKAIVKEYPQLNLS